MKAVSAIFLAAALLFADSALASTHTVKRGETLGGIAARYKCTVDAVKRANKLRTDLIRIGQELTIPEGCGAPGGGASEVITHVVIPGETLGGIAQRYGVSIDHLREMNRSINQAGLIRVGQRLRVRPTARAPERHMVRYRIQAGDTLYGIARRYGLSVRDIAAMNPRRDPDLLRIGDTITLWIEGPERRSVSAGRPQAGVLIDGEQLPAGSGWYRRRPHRAWGTNETVSALVDAFTTVRNKHPRAHDIAVGDLSAEKGGRLANHVSHQTGRDADIGYYFVGQPRNGPRAFISALRHRLDYEATWTLITTLIGPSPDKSRVEYMFMDYGVQRRIYEWAKKQGVSERTLGWMFQYPRGNRALRGMIRHEPGHAGHIHVRFRCPRGDDQCA